MTKSRWDEKSLGRKVVGTKSRLNEKSRGEVSGGETSFGTKSRVMKSRVTKSRRTPLLMNFIFIQKSVPCKQNVSGISFQIQQEA